MPTKDWNDIPDADSWNPLKRLEHFAKIHGVEALHEARDTGLPGAGSGPQDAIRHTTWNKKMKDDKGVLAAAATSFLYEIYNTMQGKQTWDDFKMDMYNNFKGYTSENKLPIDMLNDGELIINKIPDNSNFRSYSEDKN